MRTQGMMAMLAAASALAAMTGCTGVSIGQGTTAAIVVGRGAADVGNAVLDTVPFPGPEPTPVPVPSLPK